MLIINEKYAIQNGGLSIDVCEKRKRGESFEYEPRWFFPSLATALCFLVDRQVSIPDSLDQMVKDLEQLKAEIRATFNQKV